MTAKSARQVVVSGDDAPADVLRRLRQAAANGQPVELLVPADSSLLLTASEFRALREVLDRDRLAVTLVTPDPLRLQLAKLLGMPAVAREVASTAVAPPPTPVAALNSQIASSAAAHAPAAHVPAAHVSVGPATRPPVRESAQTTTRSTSEASGQPVVVPPALAVGDEERTTEPEAAWPDGPTPPEPRGRFRRRRATPPPVAEPVATGAPDPADDPDVRKVIAAAPVLEPKDAEEPVLVMPAAERRRRQHRGWLVAAGVIAGLIALGVILLPGATVALKMASQPVAANLVYDVTASGDPLSAGADLALKAVPASAAVSWEGSIPTTGTQSIPDGTASGPVSFSNPTGTAQTVAAGTELTTEDGTVFRVADAILVPARDAAGHAGRAEGKLTAAQPGSGGNVGTGEVGGKLPNGVYYSNRQQPTTGGSDKTVKVVAVADLDALRAQARVAFPDAAAKAFADSLASGQQVLTSSLQPGSPTEMFSAKAGDAADKLSLTSVWQTTGLAVDEDAIRQQLTIAADAKLAGGLPAGFAVEPSSVQQGTAAPVEEQAAGVRFQVPLTGTAVAQLTQPQRRALAEQLAGLDPAEVDAVLRQHPEIVGWSVRYWPPFLPDRMPKNVGRIQLQVGH